LSYIFIDRNVLSKLKLMETYVRSTRCQFYLAILSVDIANSVSKLNHSSLIDELARQNVEKRIKVVILPTNPINCCNPVLFDS
jgi:hypothetical protein